MRGLYAVGNPFLVARTERQDEQAGKDHDKAMSEDDPATVLPSPAEAFVIRLKDVVMRLASRKEWQ